MVGKVYGKTNAASGDMNSEQLRISEQYARLHWLLSGLVTSFALLVYVLTLCPTIAGWDSGELVTAAYTMSVAHPPGYPLYTLLGKLFTFLPFGGENIAWKVNLLSAVAGSLAAGIIFAGVYRWTGLVAAAVLASGLFAFSPLVWRFSVIAEVFALNNLFVSILFYLSIRFWQERNLKTVMLGAFVLGLGMSHHHTLVFVGLPMIIWVFIVGRDELLKPGVFLVLLGIFALGLLPYIYLPIAASHYSPDSWGNASTWDGFWVHVLRLEYGSFQLGAGNGSESMFLIGLKHYLISLPKEMFFVGIPIGFVAVWSMFKSRKMIGPEVLWLFIWMLYTIVFHYLANLDIRQTDSQGYDVHVRFWMQPNLIFSIMVGWGFAQLILHFDELKPAAWITVSLAIVTGHTIYSFTKQYQHKNTMVYEYGKQILDNLPQDAIYLSRGDLQSGSLKYLQRCEGYRTDVIVLDREMLRTGWAYDSIYKSYPYIEFPGDRYDPSGEFEKSGYQLKQFLDSNIDRNRIFLAPLSTQSWPEKEDVSWKEDYELFPTGVVNEAIRLEDFDWRQAATRSREKLATLSPPGLMIFPKGGLEHATWESYYEAHNRLGVWLLTNGIEKEGRDILREAEATLKQLIEIHPAPRDRHYKNLGIAYLHLQNDDPENRQRMIEAWEKYIEVYDGIFEDAEYKTILKMLEIETGSGRYSTAFVVTEQSSHRWFASPHRLRRATLKSYEHTIG